MSPATPVPSLLDHSEASVVSLNMVGCPVYVCPSHERYHSFELLLLKFGFENFSQILQASLLDFSQKNRATSARSALLNLLREKLQGLCRYTTQHSELGR